MLVIMIIVIVLIGLAYADYCLVDNTAHFGICFGKVAEAKAARESGLLADAIETRPASRVRGDEADGEWAPDSRTSHSDAEERTQSARHEVQHPRWLLLDLEPVLELHEGWTGAPM